MPANYGNPYNYGSPEYNPNGDSYNGQQGAATPNSTINALANNTGGGKKPGPFEAMLAHATALNSYGQPAPTPAPALQTNPFAANLARALAANGNPPLTAQGQYRATAPLIPQTPEDVTGGPRRQVVAPPTATTPSQPTSPYVDPNYLSEIFGGGGNVPPVPLPAPPPVPPPTTPPPTTTTPPPGPTPPPTPPPFVPPPAPTTPTQPTAPGTYNDVVKAIHDRFAPGFAQQQSDLARQLNAQGALTGDINSGGYGATFGRSMADLVNQQGSQEAGFLQQANENALNRGVEVYGTKAKMWSDSLGADIQKYGIDTNAGLQSYLDANDNALKAYGIDKNDLLERYKAELALKGIQYDNATKLDIATLQKVASDYATDVDRERNTMQYILGILGIDNETLKNILGADPWSVIGGWTPPTGTIVVKP